MTTNQLKSKIINTEKFVDLVERRNECKLSRNYLIFDGVCEFGLMRRLRIQSIRGIENLHRIFTF